MARKQTSDQLAALAAAPALFEVLQAEVAQAEAPVFDLTEKSGHLAVQAVQATEVTKDEEYPREKYVLGPGSETATTELPRFASPPRPSRHSRRGGRSYPEKSGQDVTRELDNEQPFMTGTTPIREYQARRAQMLLDADIRKAEGDVRYSSQVFPMNREVRAAKK